MEGKKKVSKLDIEGGGSYFLLTTLYEDGLHGFDLALSDGTDAWTGSVSKDTLSGLSRKLKMAYDEFVAQTRKALTQENIGSLHFLYQLKASATSVELIWKKHMASENIKFQLGSALLKKKDCAAVTRSIFEYTIVATSELQEAISALEADNERLIADRTTAVKRLEKCVRAKEDLEQDLYSKFTVVVNDKKAKIRSLKEEMEDVKTNASGRHLATENSDQQRIKPTSGDESDEDMKEQEIKNESDYDTDEEKNTPPQQKKSRVSSKVKEEAAEEDSLLLDDGEEEEHVPLSRGRRRRQLSAKKQTPSRPVIPKVSTSQRTPKSSNRSRSDLKKTPTGASSKSNRSSDNLDATCLLADF